MKNRTTWYDHNRWRFAWILALVVSAGVAGCYQEPTRWDQAQQQTRGQRATSRESVAGGDLNKYFPKAEGDYKITYTQEKTGFAQAELQRGGTTVATLSIFDTVNNPETAAEFGAAPEKLAGFPTRDNGSQGNSLLVADRFQVQVRSVDANFTKEERLEWLTRFDLANLLQFARTQ